MCLRELRKTSNTWKNYLNPAGSDLPLATVGEMERTLRHIGDDVIESYDVPESNMERFDLHALPVRYVVYQCVLKKFREND